MKIDAYGIDFEVDSSFTSEELDARYGFNKCRGLCSPTERKIYLASDQDPREKEVTFLHEIIEALKFVLNINLREDDIHKLDKGLHYTLTQAGVQFPKVD